MRKHYTPIRTARIQNADNIKCWPGCGAIGTHIHYIYNCKIGRVWQFLSKLVILLTHYLEIEIFSIYSKELRTYVHTKTYTPIFIVALLIIFKTGK
jgi:hypothetical protein